MVVMTPDPWEPIDVPLWGSLGRLLLESIWDSLGDSLGGPFRDLLFDLFFGPRMNLLGVSLRASLEESLRGV